MTQVELCGPFPYAAAPSKTKSQWPLLLVLFGIQFIHVLDFVILMPLGPQLMRVLDIGPQAFALLVSSYNLSAAGAGLLGAFVLDRFDRKKALVLIFSGFALGTLGCALAPAEKGLFFARIVTGAFGGLIQALVFAIVGDCISEEKRGSATGTVMSAFSVASVVGVPIGLALATRFGWRTPFLFLWLASIPILFATFKVLPPLKQHLTHHHEHAHSRAPHSTWHLIKEKNSLVAFALIISLMFAGFSVIPFISAYLVANVGLSERDLASVFFVGGLATFLSSHVIGKISDHFGKTRVFTWLASLSIIPVLFLTRLPPVPAALAIVVTTLFTVLISARSIPALTMITSAVAPVRRGRFLSLTSSVQQASSGLASIVAGSMLGQGPHGELLHFNHVGLVSITATLIAIYTARHLKVPGTFF